MDTPAFRCRGLVIQTPTRNRHRHIHKSAFKDSPDRAICFGAVRLYWGILRCLAQTRGAIGAVEEPPPAHPIDSSTLFYRIESVKSTEERPPSGLQSVVDIAFRGRGRNMFKSACLAGHLPHREGRVLYPCKSARNRLRYPLDVCIVDARSVGVYPEDLGVLAMRASTRPQLVRVGRKAIDVAKRRSERLSSCDTTSTTKPRPWRCRRE